MNSMAMNWMAIGTGIFALALLGEYILVKREFNREVAPAGDEAYFRHSSGIRTLFSISLGFAAWLSGLGQWTVGVVSMIVVALWIRSRGPGAVEFLPQGVRIRRPIIGPGREGFLRWEEIDSAVFVLCPGDGRRFEISLAAGPGRTIVFEIADPTEVLRVIEQRGIPTAGY